MNKPPSKNANHLKKSCRIISNIFKLPLLQEGTLGTKRPSTHSIETDVVFMNSGSHWKVTNEPLAIVRPDLYPSKYCPCVIAGNSQGAKKTS